MPPSCLIPVPEVFAAAVEIVPLFAAVPLKDKVPAPVIVPVLFNPLTVKTSPVGMLKVLPV